MIVKMTGELEYTTFNTRMGWVGILGSPKGLRCTTLPQPSSKEARELLGDQVNYAAISHDRFNGLIERLRAYFNGGKIDFPDKLDLSGATPFQCRVWEATKLIPYGKTRSYNWVAEQIKKPLASRAVGQALARNPLPIIIPCHRVVATNGKLGGFTGGTEIKRQLLNLETQAAIR